MLEDVYMAFSVESGAFSPGLRQQVLHSHTVHKDGQGSPNMGALSTTGYLLLSWQDNSITDRGCCEHSKARALVVNVCDWCNALLRWLMYAFKCERLTVIGSF